MAPAPLPSFATALRAWVAVGLHSFGGPAGQIAVIHRVVVAERGWLGEQRFLHALSYCMLLPGPEAQQLATYVGWLLHGVRGGLAAGLLFILPGFVTILALSLLYTAYGQFGLAQGILFGLKPVVLAVVIEAVLRLRQRAAGGLLATAIGGAAFLAVLLFQVPLPAIVAGAAVLGLLAPAAHPPAVLDPVSDAPERPNPRALLRTLATWLVIWLGPVALLLLALGPSHVLSREALFFSKAAVVTFGGAYAVLGYVAQQAVEVYGWLRPTEMLDALSLAETTPGPLIMVLQFVGYLGGYRDPGPLVPALSGVVASVVTAWVTFAPSFLFIFVGAPYIEYVRGNRRLRAAMLGITAAVVGVVAHLAVWFGLHVVFGRVGETALGPARLVVPDFATLDARALILALAAVVALFRFRVRLLPLLAGGAAVGALWSAAS